jgi:hypothetical protein
VAKKTERNRTHSARTRLTVRRVVIAVVVLGLAGTLVYEVRKLRQNPVTTTTAMEETVYDEVDTEVFVLRDEQALQADLSGYTKLLVQDGERVEAGAQIAARFADSGSAKRYADLVELRAEYARYVALASGREYSSMKVEALMQKAADRVCAFIDAADSGNIAAAKTYENDFLGQETALEIAVTGDLDLSSKIADLSQKLQAQEATVGEYESITTDIPAAGYFFSRTDGCEDVLSYADADKLTVEQIELALREKPAQSSGSKIVKSHVWYVAAILDTRTAEKLTVKKSSVRISFPKAGVQDVRATVYALHPESDGRCAAVFRCIEVSESILRLRRSEARIIFGEKTGYRVPLSAVRYLDMNTYDENGKAIVDENGENVKTKTRCVFILRGNVVSQRRLYVVYTGEDYLLSGTPDTEKDKTLTGSYVGRYDEIITGGKNLYAGAAIYE